MKYTFPSWTFYMTLTLVVLLSNCAIKKDQTIQENAAGTQELSKEDSLMYQKGIERSVNEKLRKK